MKFKQFIKNHIQRISAVILCIILMFSFSITTFALDGEVGGLDKAILKEYIKTSKVLFNPDDLPVYSPFNHDTLYYLFKWPVGTTGLEASKTECLSLTYEENGLYYTYYVFPERFTEETSGFDSLFDKVLYSSFDFPDLYVKLLGDIAVVSEDGKTISFSGSKSFGDYLTDYSIHPEALQYFKGYVYTVVRSKENSILSVNEIFYGSYNDALSQIPRSKSYFQINYFSDAFLSVDLPSFFTNESVSTKNLNNLVSVSTYSITAYDYFDDDSAASLVSTMDLKITYSLPTRVKSAEYRFYVPESIRGPNYPEGTDYLYYSSNSEYYYLKEGYLSTERPFLIVPSFHTNSSAGYYNYILVFPEDTTPLIYFRTYTNSSSNGSTYFQVISKVDYEVYSAGKLIGTFDSEAVNFHCNYKHDMRQGNFFYYSYRSGGPGDLTKDTDYNGYPYLRHYEEASYPYDEYFCLNGLYGCKTTLSLFPSNAGTLGFYTYISPDLREDIQNGNTGLPGESIVPGGSVDNGGEDFWQIDFEKDYEGILDLDLPEMPDFSYLAGLDFLDIWKLPEYTVQAFIEVVQWLAEAVSVFLETYGGPVQKLFILAGTVLNFSPDLFKFLFIFVLVCTLGMKMLQFARGSAFEIGKMTSNESQNQGSNNKNFEKKQEKEKSKAEKGGEK